MEYEIAEHESVSRFVVRAVCAVEGREPAALEPLGGVVDPGALDSLFEPRPDGTPRVGGRVSLVLSNCRVTVDNGEYLTIRPIGELERALADGEPRPDELR